jgi:hypothetical protein
MSPLPNAELRTANSAPITAFGVRCSDCGLAEALDQTREHLRHSLRNTPSFAHLIPLDDFQADAELDLRFQFGR